jgi:hypothetical protein
MLLGLGAAAALIAADAKTPTQAYLDYHAAIEKATKLEDVLPFMSAEYRGMLESQPKKDRPEWLARLKDISAMKDLKITKEKIDGTKCTLEGTGMSARGHAMRGKISLVQEGGAWKLDEEGWAT